MTGARPNKMTGRRTAPFVLGLLIVSVASGALPADPDNAALLYYQAFLLLPKCDFRTEVLLQQVTYGRDPNDTIRAYVEGCGDAIRCAEKAALAPHCDWGLPYSLGSNITWPQIETAYLLASVLHADARILASQGHYRAALRRCLTLRRFARHLGNQPIGLYACSLGAEGDAERCIIQILGSMTPDVETIQWLKSQLAVVPPPSFSPAEALRTQMELGFQTGRANPKRMARIRNHMAKSAGNEQAQQAAGLSDEGLFAYVRGPYTEFLDAAWPIVESDMLYEKAHSALQQLERDLAEKINRDPVGRVVGANIEIMADDVPRFYTTQVLSATRLNAFSVALELYLEKAQTGQLPENLPRGCPKDTYSGQDFIYTVSQNTFALRSRVQPRGRAGAPVVLECRIPVH
jgi:hypothetical protein